VASALAFAALSQIGAAQAEAAHAALQTAQLPPLTSVRLLDGPFNDAAKANRAYLLAHDADRLLAPFLREAGLGPKKPPYPNWESQGLDGHTAGHYLSALADMIASGNDADGEFSRRLDYMLTEIDRVQTANGDGYIGGIPKSREFWNVIASGNVSKTGDRWAPWYNIHKSFAGLRDAWVAGNKPKARELLVKLGDWCVNLTSKLSDDQMQQMLGHEFGGMNEVMADIYTITNDKKYLDCAKRFDHRAITAPLMRGEDQLTGKHANTQIPKIIGMAEVATLTGNQKEDAGARFFWDTVVNHRSVAFGGNSVSEHFNDPKDFSRVIEHREGPETCNTYNMLRLTEKLFASKPDARYADYYERALYNHILSAIDPVDPGYVYFTPLRPEHYRVYSKAEECFWCCVGTGMENPGRYGQFIYAQDKEGVYVNLFIPSVFKVANGISIRQDTKFPVEPSTTLTLKLDRPSTFTLRIRHPWWVPQDQMSIRVNGQAETIKSTPSSYATVRRPWQNGDKIEVDLPMHLSAESLPDGSNWAAILYGPILLASPAGRENMVGERAGDGRMAHVATGPMVPMDQVPVLLTTLEKLVKHITPDPKAGPLHFLINDVVDPKPKDGLPLVPFFSLHHSRYQMVWNLSTAEAVAKRRESLAAEERSKAALDAATLDFVRPGEQQSEVEHDFKGEKSETGIHNGRRWRHGQSIQYTLDPRGNKECRLSVTYSGDDRGRTFDIFANNQLIATQELTAESQGKFIEKGYKLPVAALSASADGRLTIKFVAKNWLAGGVYDVRLIRSTAQTPEGNSVPPKQ
jgi:DUF1680 family protein